MLKNFFESSETCCRCGCGFDITPGTREKFNKIRAEFGKPMVVSGPARCYKHNIAVGGANNSRHVCGDALDILTTSMTDLERYKLICVAGKFGATGIGIHAHFIHIDFGHPEITTWRY